MLYYIAFRVIIVDGPNITSNFFFSVGPLEPLEPAHLD